MATTSIWAIKKRMDHVISYTTNEEKTKNNNYKDNQFGDLSGVLNYATNTDKTEKQFYVTGINCAPENALEKMKETKKQYEKVGGRLAYHGYQSFAHGEVTPKQAHNIGVKLAEELWGDRFEVVVSTHLNTKCYHNHFVLNSVSFKDGKKYCNTRQDYALMRETSDILCEEFGLKVLDKTKNGRCNINYSNFTKQYVANSDYYKMVKEDVDFAIAEAYNYDDFARILKSLGYKVNYRNSCHIKSITKEPYKRPIRIERNFGLEYSPHNIMDRIRNTKPMAIYIPYANVKNKTYKSKTAIQKRKRANSWVALYYYYCYLLKIFPKKNTIQKFSPEMRGEIKKLDEYTKELRFVCKNKIEKKETLLEFKIETHTKLHLLIRKRENLWRKRKKTEGIEAKECITKQILSLTEELKFLRAEIKLCENVENKVSKMKNEIKELNEKDISKVQNRSKKQYCR